MPDVPPDYAPQAELALVDLTETVRRQAREGVDPRAIVAGLIATLTKVVAELHGPAEVPDFFLRAARESEERRKN